MLERLELQLREIPICLVINDSTFNSSDGRVVTASALVAVHSGLIPSRIKPMTLKLVFTASLLDDQHQTDSVENKPASLLAVPLERALNGIPLSWCGGQMAGNSQASSYSALIAFS